MADTMTHSRGVTVYDAARLLQISETALRGAIQYGSCRASRVGRRLRISFDELERYRQHRNR